MRRNEILGQKGKVIWLTGLSGAGKSTLALALEQKLLEKGRLAYRLDGDMLRTGLNADLGFSKEDRDENIRRIAEVARILVDAGIIALVAAISPYRTLRDFARHRIPENDFIEIYVYADLETCKSRDPKGLYKKALAGEIPDFTGISAPYEEPLSPELLIDTTTSTVEQATGKIMDLLEERLP